MADKKSNPQQIAQAVFNPNSESISIRDVTNLVPSAYNEMIMTYVNTNTEPSTITYKLNNGIVAVIAFEYDVRGRVSRVYRQS
jgi:hypothetical protein